jgi:hypothetical protein
MKYCVKCGQFGLKEHECHNRKSYHGTLAKPNVGLGFEKLSPPGFPAINVVNQTIKDCACCDYQITFVTACNEDASDGQDRYIVALRKSQYGAPCKPGQPMYWSLYRIQQSNHGPIVYSKCNNNTIWAQTLFQRSYSLSNYEHIQDELLH